MEHWKVSAIIAAIATGVAQLLGGWTPAMTTLLVIAGLDIVSGFSRAAIQKRLSSKESWQGGVKKVMMFVVIALAAQIDALLAVNDVLRNAAVIFYCVSEGLSVVENVVAAGLPVPDFIRDALAQLAERKAKPASD